MSDYKKKKMKASDNFSTEYILDFIIAANYPTYYFLSLRLLICNALPMYAINYYGSVYLIQEFHIPINKYFLVKLIVSC